MRPSSSRARVPADGPVGPTAPEYDGVRPRHRCRGYNGATHRPPRPAGAISIHDEHAPDSVLGESTNLRLVRLRLFLALITMFAIPVAIAAPVIYGLGWGFGSSLVVPTVDAARAVRRLGSVTVWLARRVLEPAERLEEARRILEDAYDRARSESLRDPLTGLGNHRGFQEEVERQWAMATRHSMPLALAIIDLDDFKQVNDTRGHAAGDRLLRQAADDHGHATCAGPTAPSGSAATSSPSSCPAPTRSRATSSSAGCWPPASTATSDGRDGVAVSFSAGISADPGPRARPRFALRPGRRGAVLGQAPRPDVRDDLRRGPPRRRRSAERPPAELSAMVARVAATGAVRAVFQPIYDLTTGAPRGFEGLVRPLPDSGFADAGSMFEAAEATGRTGELDLACLNTVMETAARLRLPGSLTINLSPRTMEMDDFSVHALLRMIVRHGLDPRHIVLELTEREAVEDIGRLRQRRRGVPGRRHPPRRRRRRCRQRRAAAPEPAPVRHRQDRPVAGPGRRRPRRVARGRPDAARPGRPLGRAGRRRRHRDAGPARRRPVARDRRGQGYLLAARPTGRRPSRSTSTRLAGARTGSSSACARCRHDRRHCTPAVRCVRG